MAETKSSSSFDILKWVVVVALLAVAAGVNVAFADESLLYRVIAILALAAVAVFVGLKTIKGAQFASLLREARIEIRKVVWPTRQETVQTTMLVLVVVLIAALILWALDSGLGWAASKIIG